MNRCSKCLLPETFPKIKFNEDNVCNYCIKYCIKYQKRTEAVLKKKGKLKNQMERLIEKNRNKSKYDCLVGLSGGKDSTYLLYLLKQEYKLNVLAYTCDTGFMSEVAHRNIRKTIDKLNVDHVWRSPGDDFYRKLYSFWLTHPSRRGYVRTVCFRCFLATEITAVKIATEMNIPLIAIGFSPAQRRRLNYKAAKIYLLTLTFWSKWYPRALFRIKLDKKERKYFDIPYKGMKKIPRILYPFSVLDYDIDKNNEKIINLGLLAPGDEHPLITNCLINLLMIDADSRRFRYSPYDWEFSQLLREGKLDRQEWLALEERVEKEIENGTFESDKINFVLEKLGLTKKDLFQ